MSRKSVLVMLIIVAVFIKFLYPMTCLIWVGFALILIAIIRGQFELYYQYKRCYAGCFYNKGSWIYAWMTKKLLVMVVSILIALPLSLSLVSFIALASLYDAIFMLVSFFVTALMFPFFVKLFQKHVAEGVLNIVSKRFTVLASMSLLVLIYATVSYHISVPGYLDPASLNHTVELATHQVGSTCVMTNYFLKIMHEFEAIGWFGMIAASDFVNGDYLVKLLWVLFFIEHALVFAALARLQLELLSFMQLKGFC